MCRWMFGLWGERKQAVTISERSTEGLAKVRTGKVVKRVYLRRSPRKLTHSGSMSATVVEHYQFPILPGTEPCWIIQFLQSNLK